MPTDPASDISNATTVHRWVAPIALLVAVVAAATAAFALTRQPQATSASAPAPQAPSVESNSKEAVCAAFDTVSTAVNVQTHADLGADPVPQAAVAGNARLSLIGGSQYLLNSIGPDTPAELAAPVRSFAGDLAAIGINALAGASFTEAAQADRLARAEANRTTITEICK